jgi:hypothetical protein
VDAINGHIQYERKTEHLKKIQMCATHSTPPLRNEHSLSRACACVGSKACVCLTHSCMMACVAHSEAAMVEEEMSQQVGPTVIAL